MRRTHGIRLWSTFFLLLAGCTTQFGTGGDSDAGDTPPDEDAEAVDTPPDGDAPDTEPPECTTDEECENSVFCDGRETCGPAGTCLPGDPVDCDDANPCSDDFCDVGADECRNPPLDADLDGYRAATAPTGEECPGDDCDDTNPGVHPGADESCNDADDDCDGWSDEGLLEGLSAPDIMVDDAPGDHYQIRACWQGSEYGVAWRHTVLEGGTYVSKLYFLRVDPSGAPVGSPVSVATESDVRRVWELDIACGPAYYGLVASAEPASGTGRIAYLYLFSTSGGAWSRTTMSESTGHDLASPAIAYDPLQRSWGVVWTDVTGELIMYRKATLSGATSGTGVTLARGTAMSGPRIAANGDGLFGFSWIDWGTGAGQLQFREIDTSGTSMTGTCTVDSTGPTPVTGGIASAGAGLPYGIAWHRGPYGAEESFFATVEIAAGTPSLASGPTAVSTLDTVSSRFPAVDFWDARSAFLVAWTDFTGAPTGSSIASIGTLRIDPAGVPVEAAIQVSATTGMPWAPEVVEDESGGSAAVLWDDMRMHSTDYVYDLYLDFVGCPP